MAYRKPGGKGWALPSPGGTSAAPMMAVSQSQPGVPACLLVGTSDTAGHHWPPLPPPMGLAGSVGMSSVFTPCYVRLLLSGMGPSLGSPVTGLGQALLSAHLDYGTSLLTGLPAFSLSQIQLLLHTAARVSSLKHKPERVTPPLGLRLLAARGTGNAVCLRTGQSLHLECPFLFVKSPALSSEAGKWPHPCQVLTILPSESSVGFMLCL